MRKKPESEEDEFSVDEPEEFQESDDDWTPAANEAKGRRQPLRSSRKRSYVQATDSSDDSDDNDSDENDSDDGKNRKRNRGRMKVKKIVPKPIAKPAAQRLAAATTTTAAPCVPVQAEATSTTPNAIVEKEFSSGAFIVLKADLEKEEYPPIWKIDGKALLQKYQPVENGEKGFYKNTSTYSGWSISNKDQYYPAPINFKTQNRKETIVELLKSEIPVSTAENEESE